MCLQMRKDENGHKYMDCSIEHCFCVFFFLTTITTTSPIYGVFSLRKINNFIFAMQHSILN